MALYAFDGTWDDAKNTEVPAPSDTNVVRFFRAYSKRSGTNDYYLAGVGTRTDVLGKILGGVFGLGEASRLDDAYNHLCTQWAAGDKVIDIVGFSRGAATTLDFVHRVMDQGIRQPGSNTVVEASPKIRFLGVWDVVAAFGLAQSGRRPPQHRASSVAPENQPCSIAFTRWRSTSGGHPSSRRACPAPVKCGSAASIPTSVVATRTSD